MTQMFKERPCQVRELGYIDYRKAIDIQKTTVEDVIAGRAPETILVCEHPSVITMGRRAKKENILVPNEDLKRLGIPVYVVDRGGDVTFHGPGQLVFYPILDLRQGARDLHLYLRNLELGIIDILRDNFGLNAYRNKEMTGVWVGPYKVASIGIGVRHWVTYHGFSLNVKVDKRYFELIKSCGQDVQLASLNDFFDDEVTMVGIREVLLEGLREVFGLDTYY